MSVIDKTVQATLEKALHSYYDALNRGDLKTISDLMTRESFLISLQSLGFRRAFRDGHFKKLLKAIEEDEKALKEVTAILGADLAKEARKHRLEEIRFESKGADRITLRYSEDCHPKQLYFSSCASGWKIDYKAGRQKS